MHKNIIEPFSGLQATELPHGLADKVINRLHQERRLMIIRQRIIIWGITTASSALVLIPTFRMLQVNLIDSGFLQFFSLLFSDSKVILSYWDAFAWSLLEALPVMSLVLFLAILGIFLKSLSVLTKNVKNIMVAV